jgi:hypothetical protein
MPGHEPGIDFVNLRTPTSIKAACCSAVFTGTKRIVGRLIASQSASASAASFLPRLQLRIFLGLGREESVAHYLAQLDTADRQEP